MWLLGWLLGCSVFINLFYSFFVLHPSTETSVETSGVGYSHLWEIHSLFIAAVDRSIKLVKVYFQQLLL